MKINILTLSFGLLVLGVLAAQNPSDKRTNPKSGESIDFNKSPFDFSKTIKWCETDPGRSRLFGARQNRS
jgi:hypothetical protein